MGKGRGWAKREGGEIGGRDRMKRMGREGKERGKARERKRRGD